MEKFQRLSYISYDYKANGIRNLLKKENRNS